MFYLKMCSSKVGSRFLFKEEFEKMLVKKKNKKNKTKNKRHTCSSTTKRVTWSGPVEDGIWPSQRNVEQMGFLTVPNK